MVVVTDHDSKVLARKTFRCRAWDLGTALDWAAGRAGAAGFAGVTVACEPTGHRWRVLGQMAADRPADHTTSLLYPGTGRRDLGRLRHLGTRREQLIVEAVSQIQQIRALLECVWPAALDTAAQPFRSRTWVAAMSTICDRDGGDLARTRRLGLAPFRADGSRDRASARRTRARGDYVCGSLTALVHGF